MVAPAESLSAILESDADFQASWDNTIRLSAIHQPGRTELNIAGYCAPGGSAPAAPRGCSYGGGFTSGRMDWVSELDIAYRDFGVHVSSAAWVDAVDRSRGAQNAARGAGPAAAYYDPSELGGRHIELDEGFVHGSADLPDDQSLSFRVGRHVLIWGESVYFAENAIAAGQAPIDTYQARTVAPYQASRDLFLPIGQASFSWQIGDGLAIEGYYQLEWRRSRINPEDAYATATDVAGAEENREIALPVSRSDPIDYYRISDEGPGASGQYGVAIKWRAGDLDLGLYGVRYNAKVPTIQFQSDPMSTGEYSPARAYRLVYPRGIQIYGASISGSLGQVVLGGEVSARRQMPLINRGIYVSPGEGGQGDLIPRADTLHAQLSWRYMTPPLPWIAGGANWTGEIAANQVFGAVTNEGSLETGSTHAAAAFRTVFEPQFFRVLPRVDLSVPIALGYGFFGRSSVIPAMTRGAGDIDIAVRATIDRTWTATLGFTHYFGTSHNSELLFSNRIGSEPLSDWDYVSISIERTF